MLLIVIILMVLSSIIFLCFARNRRSLLIFLMTASLALFITSILIYVAKKGGIANETSLLLFGFSSIRNIMQYLPLTLGQLGYLVALGRFIFPLILIINALDFSYFDFAVRMRKKAYIFAVLPIISLVLYIPKIFESLVSKNNIILKAFVYGSRCWIFLYIIIALFIMVYEYFSITSLFFRRRFIPKILLLASVAIIYSLYAPQDPAQIYLFYRNDYMWMLGLWYINSGLSTPLYFIVMVLSILCSIIGFISLIKYMSTILDQEREEVVLKQKAKAASVGVSAFVHGTKNELLASRVLISRLEKSGVEGSDIENLKALNDNLITRMQRLYSTLREQTIKLSLVSLESVINKALELSYSSHSDLCVEVLSYDKNLLILASSFELAEAISNIIINGWEAMTQKGKIEVEVKIERLWISISILDRGPGIPKSLRKKIWEPFYSSKNSSSNWGMGMYYTRKIVNSHLGSIRFEDRKGGGTVFQILLPRYGRIRGGLQKE